MSIPPFGGAPTPDATATKKGKVALAGDFTGSAASPALAAIIAASTVGSSTLVPVITFDAKGRITVATTVAISAGQATPTILADSATFTVAADTQIVTGVPIVMGYGSIVELALGAVLVTVGQP